MYWAAIVGLCECQVIIEATVLSLRFKKKGMQARANTYYSTIREYGSTLYVGLARAVSPTNTNFRITLLLTRLQEALYEDLAV